MTLLRPDPLKFESCLESCESTIDLQQTCGKKRGSEWVVAVRDVTMAAIISCPPGTAAGLPMTEPANSCT